MPPRRTASAGNPAGGTGSASPHRPGPGGRCSPGGNPPRDASRAGIRPSGRVTESGRPMAPSASKLLDLAQAGMEAKLKADQDLRRRRAGAQPAAHPDAPGYAKPAFPGTGCSQPRRPGWPHPGAGQWGWRRSPPAGGVPGQQPDRSPRGNPAVRHPAACCARCGRNRISRSPSASRLRKCRRPIEPKPAIKIFMAWPRIPRRAGVAIGDLAENLPVAAR